LLVLGAFPLAWMLSTSLKPSGEIFATPPGLVPARPTLDNFGRLLSETRFLTFFENSALVSAAKMCGGTLMIVEDVTGSENDPPALHYIAGRTASSDVAEWWRPTLAWFRQVLPRLGFQTVDVVGTVTGSIRPSASAIESPSSMRGDNRWRANAASGRTILVWGESCCCVTNVSNKLSLLWYSRDSAGCNQLSRRD